MDYCSEKFQWHNRNRNRDLPACSAVPQPTVPPRTLLVIVKSKGKVATLQIRLWPRGGGWGRGIALIFQDLGARGGWVVSSTPRPHFTRGKDPVPIVQEAGWAPGPVWTGGKSRTPPGFDSRTVQPVVSRYTDWATRPTSCYCTTLIIESAAPPKWRKICTYSYINHIISQTSNLNKDSG